MRPAANARPSRRQNAGQGAGLAYLPGPADSFAQDAARDKPRRLLTLGREACRRQSAKRRPAFPETVKS